MGQRDPDRGEKPAQEGYTVPPLSGPYGDHVDKWIPDPKGSGKGKAPNAEPSACQEAKSSDDKRSSGKGVGSTPGARSQLGKDAGKPESEAAGRTGEWSSSWKT